MTCLELLAFTGGVTLDETLREAFEGGLIDTDAEEGIWYSLPIGEVEGGVARDEEGAALIFVKVESSEQLKSAVSIVLYVCGNYDLN